jgi:hypothetical protein
MAPLRNTDTHHSAPGRTAPHPHRLIDGRMPYGRASSVKGRCAEILTRSVLAYGCAPRAASGLTLDRAQPAGTVPPGDRYTVQCKGRPCAALLPKVVNVRMEKGKESAPAGRVSGSHLGGQFLPPNPHEGF